VPHDVNGLEHKFRERGSGAKPFINARLLERMNEIQPPLSV
jgi:hypothetical protein